MDAKNFDMNGTIKNSCQFEVSNQFQSAKKRLEKVLQNSSLKLEEEDQKQLYKITDYIFGLELIDFTEGVKSKVLKDLECILDKYTL